MAKLKVLSSLREGSATIGSSVQRIFFIRHSLKAARPTLVTDCGYIVCPVGSNLLLVNVYMPEDENGIGHLELREAKEFLPYQEDNGGQIVELFFDIARMISKVNDIHNEAGVKLKMKDVGFDRFMSYWSEPEVADGRQA